MGTDTVLLSKEMKLDNSNISYSVLDIMEKTF